jgi:hypothetical protein
VIQGFISGFLSDGSIEKAREFYLDLDCIFNWSSDF